MNYFTQDEFQADHPATDLSQFTSATVSGMISKASQYVDNFCQVDGFDLATVTGEKVETIITNEGDLIFYPRRNPVLSVSAINLSRGTWSLDLTLTAGSTNLVQIPTRGTSILYPNTFLTSVGTFTINDLIHLRGRTIYSTVSYYGGYQTIPPQLKGAAMLVFRDMANRRLNVGGASSITQGGISIKYSNRDDGKSDDMQDAQLLMQDFVRRVPV